LILNKITIPRDQKVFRDLILGIISKDISIYVVLELLAVRYMERRDLVGDST